MVGVGKRRAWPAFSSKTREALERFEADRHAGGRQDRHVDRRKAASVVAVVAADGWSGRGCRCPQPSPRAWNAPSEHPLADGDPARKPRRSSSLTAGSMSHNSAPLPAEANQRHRRTARPCSSSVRPAPVRLEAGADTSAASMREADSPARATAPPRMFVAIDGSGSGRGGDCRPDQGDSTPGGAGEALRRRRHQASSC